MRIIYSQRDERDMLGVDLCGTFSTDRAAAETFALRSLAEHGLACDRHLLEWIRNLPHSANEVEMPTDSLDAERMVYVLADLIEQNGDIVVHCRKCNALVPLDGITSEEKDFSTESSGMRMGFAGDLYRCPNLHGLLFSVTKIF
jgi:hypothetical protein